MTYSMIVGKYKLIFSDTHFKDFRKKPTISVYDADTNSEMKIASFNSQETFEWFIEAVEVADRKTEPQNDWETEKRDNSLCYKCVKECDRRVLNRYTIECNQYEPKDEPTSSKMEQVDETQTDCAWK